MLKCHAALGPLANMPALERPASIYGLWQPSGGMRRSRGGHIFQCPSSGHGILSHKAYLTGYPTSTVLSKLLTEFFPGYDFSCGSSFHEWGTPEVDVPDLVNLEQVSDVSYFETGLVQVPFASLAVVFPTAEAFFTSTGTAIVGSTATSSAATTGGLVFAAGESHFVCSVDRNPSLDT